MERRDMLKWMGTMATSAALGPSLHATEHLYAQAGTARSFDPAFATAVETAEAIRRKRISARESTTGSLRCLPTSGTCTRTL
jgi:hypothetical protein